MNRDQAPATSNVGASSPGHAGSSLRTEAGACTYAPYRKGSTVAVTVDEDALLSTVGAAIIARREELGLSQRALGLEAGVERNMLRGVEEGSRRATIVTLARIAAALQLPLTQLLTDTA